MFTLRKPYRLLSVLVGMALCPAASYGQGSVLPNKPVRFVVPFAAAGPNDFVGRMIAPKLSETLHQNVIVDNRPSANGVIGSELVARAVADGSVLAVGNSGTHAINATLYRNPTYDPVRDFAPISEIVSSSLVLVAHPSVAANNIKELIAEAKRAPGKLNIAIGGPAGEIARIANMPEVRERFVTSGYEVVGSTPEQFAERVRRDTEKYRKIIIESGMQQL